MAVLEFPVSRQKHGAAHQPSSIVEPLFRLVLEDLEAVGKKSVQFTKKGRRPRPHDATLAFEARVRAEAALVWKPRPPLAVSVEMLIDITFAPYESWSGRKAARHMGEPAERKPDWDNIGKSIGDALETVVLDDDKRVTFGAVRKRYGKVARIDIQIGHPGFLVSALRRLDQFDGDDGQ